ncbi:MAG TPA: ACT domain-containing protein [Planctomycetaceae bacterium]|nr:ACT domain-containing protein [Planctomycetaceae bacterium]
MAQRYVINVFAANRVGVLAALATALAELGGNLVEVSQTVMQQFFTIIFAADFPENRDPQVIVDHIRGVCRPFGAEVWLKDPLVEILQDPAPGAASYFLTLRGPDAPGVTRRVSARLAEERIDIVELHAARQPDDAFEMVLELAVPPAVDPTRLREQLAAMGAEMGLAVALQQASEFAVANGPRVGRASPG